MVAKEQKSRFEGFCWKPCCKNSTKDITRTWKYVQSKENPADLPTKGLKAADLELLEFWWNGPAFLYEEKDEWKKLTSYQQRMHQKKYERKQNGKLDGELK